MATQFDNYFFNGGLEDDAEKAVAQAVAQAKAAGLPLAVAMNPDLPPSPAGAADSEGNVDQVPDEG